MDTTSYYVAEEATCEMCGHLSAWASHRFHRGETPLCWSCISEKNSTSDTVPTCRCDFSVGRLSCECEYHEYMKKKRVREEWRSKK